MAPHVASEEFWPRAVRLVLEEGESADAATRDLDLIESSPRPRVTSWAGSLVDEFNRKHPPPTGHGELEESDIGVEAMPMIPNSATILQISHELISLDGRPMDHHA